MNDLSSRIQIEWKNGISDVSKADWDSLALSLDTPFLEWEWIYLIESSNSASPEYGWVPKHLLLWLDKRLVGAALLYLKYNSSGEFVFDHIWWELSEKMGVSYYPKLIGMTPFTPVSGYRFLIAPDMEESILTGIMTESIDDFCQKSGIASCNFNFVDKEWKSVMEKQGLSAWHHQNFIWENPGYASFDEYLAEFKTNQRKNIKKERNQLKKQEITVQCFTGKEISIEYVRLMYEFYHRTNEIYGPWACKYLTREFFDQLYDSYRHRSLFIAAFEPADDNPVGMSMLVYKGDWLFGRYWGSRKYIPYLHFELCYYKPIEWSIATGIKYYDPGMGGYHKLRRGFRVVSNYSLHRFYDSRLSWIFNMYIDEINRMEQEQNEYLNCEVPIKMNK